MKHSLIHTLLALLFLAPLPLSGPSFAHAQSVGVIAVNSTDDAPDHTFSDQICDADPGPAVKCTLRAALMEANFFPDPNTIEVPNGTYKLTLKQTSGPIGSSGMLQIFTPMTVMGVGGTPPVIDATGLGERVLSIALTKGVQLQRLTLRGGSPLGDQGGGIRITSSASVTMQQCTIENNTTHDGGGIAVIGTSFLSLERSTIRGNTAIVGGGLFVAEGSKAVVQDSRIAGNTAQGSSNPQGGGIFGSGSTKLEINGSSVQDNVAAAAGGGIYTNGQIIIRTTTISGNRAALPGGGISITEFGQSEAAVLRIFDSTITNNQGDFGGGLRIGAGVTNFLSNTTVSGNVSTAGGGIFSEAQLRLQNVTITRNLANIGVGGASAPSITANSSIIASNSAFDAPDCLSTLKINGDYNLSTGCAFANPAKNFAVADPKLGPLQFNGGPTATHQPLPGSPAIDAVAQFFRCTPSDQRGVKRFQGAQCDIGAVETPGRSAVGVGAIAPAHLAASTTQTSTLVVSWTTPAPMTWSDLSTLELQLADEEGHRPLLLRFTEGLTQTGGLTLTNGLALYNSDGTLAGAGEAGSDGALESDGVQLDLARSAVDGPPGQTVTLRLALRFAPEVAGRTYTGSLMATDDAGALQGPEAAGTVTVGPFQVLLPLAVWPPRCADQGCVIVAATRPAAG